MKTSKRIISLLLTALLSLTLLPAPAYADGWNVSAGGGGGGLSSPLYFQTCAFPRLWRHFRTTSEKTYNHPSEALKPGPLFFGKKFGKKFTNNGTARHNHPQGYRLQSRYQHERGPASQSAAEAAALSCCGRVRSLAVPEDKSHSSQELVLPLGNFCILQQNHLLPFPNQQQTLSQPTLKAKKGKQPLNIGKEYNMKHEKSGPYITSKSRFPYIAMSFR